MLDELKNSYDWEEVFAYASGKDGPLSLCEGSKCSASTFTIDDVESVLALSEGENDGPEWLILVSLKDGRYGYIEAGCDYTGWDCQASGSVWVSHDLENIWRFGLTQPARERLLRDQRTLPDVNAIAMKHIMEGVRSLWDYVTADEN